MFSQLSRSWFTFKMWVQLSLSMWGSLRWVICKCFLSLHVCSNRSESSEPTLPKLTCKKKTRYVKSIKIINKYPRLDMSKSLGISIFLLPFSSSSSSSPLESIYLSKFVLFSYSIGTKDTLNLIFTLSLNTTQFNLVLILSWLHPILV